MMPTKQPSLLALMLIAFLSLWTLSAESMEETGLVVGVFDQHYYKDSFQLVTRKNFSDSRFISYSTVNRSIVKVLAEICALDGIAYFYVMSDLPTSHIISQLAAMKGVPMFLYSTGHDYQTASMLPQRPPPGVFTLNDVLSNEGRAWAEVIYLSGWRYVNVVVQSSIRYDKLIESLDDQYSRIHGGVINKFEVLQHQTPWSVLIDYQRSLTYSTSRSYLAYEVILVHAEPEFTRQLVHGADLIFHDQKIIWLITSTSMSNQLLSGHFSLLTLSDELNPDTTNDFIRDLLEILDQKETPTIKSPIGGCNGSIQIELLEENQLILERNGLVSGSSVTYYKYTVRALFGFEGATWRNISSIDTIHGQGFPTVSQALNDVPRKTNTVVTKIDKPFVMETPPATFDGTEYCQTPTVPCLKIPQEVIINHHYSSEITKVIFDDFFEGRKEPGREYSLSCCQGLSVDLLKSLYSDFELEFQLYLAPDDQFGAFDLTTSNWSGLVKELIDGRADMVMASFSITSPRSAVIDYSAPYYHSGFALVSITRPDVTTNLLSFMEPFPMLVWPAIMGVCVITFLCQAMVEWYSPRGINHSRQADKPTYSLSSAIKTIFSMICGHTIPTKMPESLSAKFIQCFWGFFSIIYLANYTANLTSILADRTKITEVDSIYSDELLKLRTASITNSAAEGYVKVIRPDLYERMRKIKILTTQDGIDALRNDELDVFIHDTPVVDYIVSNENFDCRMRKLATFSVDSYGVAFPLDEAQDLQAAVTSKVLEYRSSGYIEKLRKIYFPRSSASGSCTSTITSLEGVKFTLSKASGLLLVLVIATCLSSILLFMEHAIYKFLIPYLKRKPKDSFWRSPSVMFLSQRVFRGISKDGNGSKEVFREFVNRIKSGISTDEIKRTRQKAKLVFQSSFTKEQQNKITLYDVVLLAYLKKYNRPLTAVYQNRKLKASQLHGCRIESKEKSAIEMKEYLSHKGLIEKKMLPSDSPIADHDSGHSSTVYDKDNLGTLGPYSRTLPCTRAIYNGNSKPATNSSPNHKTIGAKTTTYDTGDNHNSVDNCITSANSVSCV